MKKVTYALTRSRIRKTLDQLANTDKHVKQAINLVGYPDERRNKTGFPILLRVMIGQQLSVKAATAINTRVLALMNQKPTPEKIMQLDDAALRQAGLSRQKISYTRSLSESIINQTLEPDNLWHLDDEAAITKIIQVKGLGRWSAEMYLMFSLGRIDIWPVDDLAVRAGIGRICGLENRPTAKELKAIGEKWQPYRSAMALLAWHYYSNAPV